MKKQPGELAAYILMGWIAMIVGVLMVWSIIKLFKILIIFL